MALTRVLITVKTYPTLSATYDELVCTAGFLEDGRMVRIYPVPFRQKPYHEQYKKYDWVEVDLVKNEKDFRPESYRPRTTETAFTVTGHIDTRKGDWSQRKQICLKKVFTNLESLIADAKNQEIGTSLAVFKPGKILDFLIEPDEPEWDKAKLDALRQGNLFEKRDGSFEVVRKLPIKAKYRFVDETGKQSTLMVEDWELGALFWRIMDETAGNLEIAKSKLREKFFDELAVQKDLYFFLGTTLAYHMRSHNPFMIIGLFYPKKEMQLGLF
jgi:hypothetical protein